MMMNVDVAYMGEEISGNSVQALLAEVNGLAAELRKPMTVAGRTTSVPAGERSILQALGEQGPRTVPEIARARGTSRQSVQMLVNRLKGQGWAELNVNPAHKRSALVCLTAEGKALLDEVTVGQTTLLQARLVGLSETDVIHACGLLRQVRRALAGETPVQAEAALSRPVSRGRARTPQDGVQRREDESADMANTAGAVEHPMPGPDPSSGSALAEGVARWGAGEAQAEEFPVSLL